MNDNATRPVNRKPRGRSESRSPIASAPRQPLASEAWKQFADRLVGALIALEEDEYLILQVKGTGRYLQFMDQGSYGMRVESVSDYYLSEEEHLSEADYGCLVRLGWHAPTQLPGTAGQVCDGSTNYYLDLAHPLPIQDIAVLAVLTLLNVHNAGHPGRLEYVARSASGMSIRFPHLQVRRRVEAQA